MAVTAGDVARAALADLNEDSSGVLNALRWVAERYSQLAGRRLKQLRRVGEFVIPAAITAGTVTASRGSAAVAGDGTAAAAWGPSLVGRFLRIRNAWYEIGAVSSDHATLMLKTEFAEDDAAGATYQIVQRYISLPYEVQFLGTFVHERLFLELEKWSLAELDMSAPERLYVTSGPAVAVEIGEDEDGAKKFEFYPYSTTTEHIAFTYWARPPKAMQESTILPGAITVGELKEGVLINLKQHKMAQAAAADKAEMAAFWRNEYRAQETIWNRDTIPAICKRDQGVEDRVVLLRSARGRHHLSTIENAHDEIFARGGRP